MSEIRVRRRTSGLPYSKGLMAQSIMATGLPPAQAYALARLIEDRLPRTGAGELSVPELRAIAESVLLDEVGPAAVERYRRWQLLDQLDHPLVVLIGGTAGTGKSTIAASLAHRLGITRLTSTDMIRHVLRTFFSSDVMPDVHFSSFEAAAAVGLHDDDEDLDLAGFRAQADHVGAAVRAIIERAVRERTPLVLEGVHLVPGILPARLLNAALVVHLILVVSDEAVHRGHFEMRSEAQARGPSQRYIAALPQIRKIQDDLVRRARRANVPVLENVSLDESLAAVLSLVLEAAVDHGPAIRAARPGVLAAR
jgi:2-phosphoglycerate kinase